ncbi:ubiquitin carboxyl-terminal hydrolase 16 isoform X2 [Coccinella septempunctata]|uniref:ubiquitin carboxyl-terminal hydrolase 16 isoform X2 n=1 Tax=Coccinella septempunctata TaxID=41139 RepID=UPI001D08F59B|nr:ubiquitin carboxyl-terminal hydrolase 16 isoform X2 [Coccinella septempunctata]
MMKKKHQGDPNEHSTDSCDENQNSVVECPHINKSVDLQKIKKSLVKSGFLKDCEECKKVPQVTQDDEMELEYDLSLWMCLRCGNQACGRGKNQHAIKHFETPHSDEHCLCVNTTIWNVWCYKCDDEVNISCKRKLLEAVEYLRKHSESFHKLPVNNPIPQNGLEIIPLPEPQNLLNNATAKSTYLPRARGLTNLGNTCFFNSVIQCLGQTPYLLELLCEAENPGQHIVLPGGKLDPSNKDSPELQPIAGELGKWKPLTNVLADTLRELRSGRAEVYTPRLLHSRVTNRLPQFAGGDQHDSHELLRHLLDATREEDIKRYQALILENKGFKDVNPATVSDEDKKMVKFYAHQAEALLPIDQIFRGVLVSTLQCQECRHTSHRDENFLDLSLPVVEKQLPPRRKAEEIEEKPSKHQIKKEKRAERKKNKQQKYQKFQFNGSDGTNSLQNNGKIEKSDSESDADVEDNAEDSTSMGNQADDAPIKGTESGYNSDKVYNNSSPDSNDRGMSPVTHVDDSGIPSPTSTGVMNLSPSGVTKMFSNSLPSSPSSIGTNYADMGSPICGHNSPIEEDKPEDMERPESRLSFNNNNNNNRSSDLKVGLEKLILNDGDSAKVNFLCNDNNATTSNYERSLSNEDEKMEEDDEPQEDPNMWTTTFSPRYQCKELECSIQSCLNQFTTWEYLNGCNKVTCDACTERLGGPEKKVQYNNATKQLLIYNPPAVLILHLKRFQVFRFRSVKVCKNVNFPAVLDIAPFVSKRSRSLPTFQEDQTKILYSLYGVVEHSGSINGGHYVAYVKVRPQLDKNSYRWNFLPRNQAAKVDKIPPPSDPEVPSGKWYYISDSFVTEVTEEKVLASQAYLLFYERIL